MGLDRRPRLARGAARRGHGRGWLPVVEFAQPVHRHAGRVVDGFRGRVVVVGRALVGPLGLGDAGSPVAATETKRVVLELAYFYGLGTLIIFLGAIALGRLSIRSARDIRYSQRSVITTTEPAPSEDVTEIQPAEVEQPRHRPFGGMFGRRHVPQ